MRHRLAHRSEPLAIAVAAKLELEERIRDRRACLSRHRLWRAERQGEGGRNGMQRREPHTLGNAHAAAAHPLLKLKLGGGGDRERLAAVREAVPHARLIADANEAWQPDDLESLLAAATAARVELVEQPLPADRDELLSGIARPVPVCADESVHDRASLEAIALRYDAVNIKLDKTGGLTEALLVAAEARALGLKIMVGSMVATSLSMAPALLLAQEADWVDLDGPLLLARDRVPGLAYEAGMVFPPPPGLWG